MAVDMYEHRFREEISRNPAFVMPAIRDPAVWQVGFPAWRALFSSQLYYGHSTGYRVPDFESFYHYVERAWTRKHPQRERFKPYFEGPLREAMRQRVAVWYSSGMAEHQVYLGLVQAFEDANPKAGLVFYDGRLDWKMKCDALVICSGLLFRVHVFWGDERDRPLIEAERDAVEQERKKNTSMSSHWCNAQIANIVDVKISPESTDDVVTVNGLRLFSHAALNRVLLRIYEQAGIYNGFLHGRRQGVAEHH